MSYTVLHNASEADMQGKYALDSMGIHCVKRGLSVDVPEMDCRDQLNRVRKSGVPMSGPLANCRGCTRGLFWI
jgi:hypothetical protein